VDGGALADALNGRKETPEPTDATREGLTNVAAKDFCERLRAEEFQILLGYQKPVEHLIAAPLQIESLTGERLAWLGNAGVRDFHNASDRVAQHQWE
jgi:hypothetical protein